MGVALNARLMNLSKQELAVLLGQKKGPEGRRFNLLRKVVTASSIAENEINDWFDNKWEQTSDAFSANWGDDGAGYRLGMLIPILLNLKPGDPALKEWQDGVTKFQTEAEDLYKELTAVISYLLRLSQEMAGRKGARIRFSLSKKPRYKAIYRVAIHNNRVFAKIRVEGPCFMVERPDQP